MLMESEPAGAQEHVLMVRVLIKSVQGLNLFSSHVVNETTDIQCHYRMLPQ